MSAINCTSQARRKIYTTIFTFLLLFQTTASFVLVRPKSTPSSLLSSVVSSSRPPHSILHSASVSDSTAPSTPEDLLKDTEQRTVVPKLDLPWDDLKTFTLVDNLPKYTCQLCLDDNDHNKSLIACTLWRSMVENVDELAGYPIDFLIQRYQDLQTTNSDQHQQQQLKTVSTTVLPLLDQYEFTSSGGISGLVYGVPGVADGTRIVTSPVVNVQTTLPKGFVMTQEQILYEVNTPLMVVGNDNGRGNNDNKYSLKNGAAAFQTAAANLVPTTATEKGLATIEGESVLDADVLNLGALTAALVGGALAFESLSHHLTINVFWV